MPRSSSSGGGSPAPPPPGGPGVVSVTLPSNQVIQVTVTSTSCTYYKKTDIQWPDGTTSTFITPSPASAGVVTYGLLAYQGMGGTATVRISERPNPGVPWTACGSATVRLKSSPPPKSVVVEHEGVPGVPSHVDWDDTLVWFQW